MSCCPRVACGGGGCCSGCGREETGLEGFMTTGTMMDSELEEIVLCMSGEGVHGEVGMYVRTQLVKTSNTDMIKRTSICILYTRNNRQEEGCVCVCCYREHITNRSGLVGLRCATGLDLNLSNHTACESLM